VNSFIENIGVSIPLIQGPMGGVSGPELVAAVANSGALGVLPIWADSLEVAHKSITKTQKKTSKVFAVNLRSDLNQLEHISMSADLGINVFHLFWGDPSESAVSIRSRKCKFIATVFDEDSAMRALDAGAAALVAQGVEAGGHVLSEIPLTELVDHVISLSGGIPVIAAGGIARPEEAKSYLDRGASGVLCGTRFVASLESEAHDEYKTAIIQASGESTARSICFDLGWPDAPHRTLRNSTYQMWKNAGFPPMGERPGEGDMVLTYQEGHSLPRYFVMPPKKGMSGDILAAALYAGTGVNGIKSNLSASNIVSCFAEKLCC